MITPRFYLPPKNWASPSPWLSEADTHHCANVLRMEVGDDVIVFDGQGKEATATITQFRKQGKYHAVLSLGVQTQTPPPHARITLAQGVPKSKSMDFIIQKAVELGASRIVPLLSERTILRCADEADASHKRERWEAIAIEACKQCGQNWLPVIEVPCSLKAFFEKNRVLSKRAEADEVQGASGAQKRSVHKVLESPGSWEASGQTAAGSPKGETSGSERVNSSTEATQQFAASVEFRKNSSDATHLLLIASLEEERRSLKEVLAARSGLACGLAEEVTVMIGPEGDFTPAESAAAKKLGYQPIHLGPIVLRSETAAIYCLSVLAHELF